MKYSMIQISPETHELLKEYCDEHGYKISAIVDKIIKKHIQPSPKITEDMRRCFVDLLNTQAVQNELITYELDPKDRTIIVNKTKLKQINKK
jgi:uncharacterized linocin/CFP29 family protein